MSLTDLILRRRRAEIGILTIDATVSEEHSHEAEITEHPIENGGDVVDHIRKKPVVVTLSGVISDTPLEFLAAFRTEVFSGESKTQQGWDYLVGLQENRELVDIVTTLKEYQNMALVSLSVPRDAARGNALHFTATFRQIQKVETATVAAKENRDERPKTVRKGKQAPKEPPEPEQNSILGQATGWGSR